MLTPASSDLQEPLKFSELRMESVQSHFKNLKYAKMWAVRLSAPATPFCGLLRRMSAPPWRTGVPHLVSYLLAPAKRSCDTMVSHKSVSGGWIPYGIHGGRCLPPDKAICNNILWNLYKIWGELVLFWVISASGKTDGFVDIGHPPHHLRRYASIYLQNNACSSFSLLFSKVE